MNPNLGLQQVIKERLQRHVEYLSMMRCHYLSEKNVTKAILYITDQMKELGYHVNLHQFTVAGNIATNIECWSSNEKPRDITVILTAHHDTYLATPGADDNASAIAVLIETARLLASNTEEKGIGFVFFDLEELTMKMLDVILVQLYYFLSIENTTDPSRKEELTLRKERYLEKNSRFLGNISLEGSQRWIFERMLEFSNLKAVINLESVGYTSKEKQSQKSIPTTSYLPSTGDFLGITYTEESRWLFSKLFIPTKAARLKLVPIKVEPDDLVFAHRSDHANFWNIGFPAVMLTDTFEYRNPHYHEKSDNPDTLDYEFMTAQVRWLSNILPDLAKDLKTMKVW